MITNSIRFVLSQPITGAPSSADTRLWPAIFDAADRFTPMTPTEQEALIATAGTYEPLWAPAATA